MMSPIEILLIAFVLGLFLVRGFAAATAKGFLIVTGGLLLLIGLGVAILTGIFSARGGHHYSRIVPPVDFDHEMIHACDGSIVMVQHRRAPAPPAAARVLNTVPPVGQIAQAEIQAGVPDEIAKAIVDPAPLPKAVRPRPSWVDEPAGRKGDDYYMTVHVGPFADSQLLRKALPKEIREASRTFVDSVLENEPEARQVELPYAYLHDAVVVDEFEEPYVSPTVGLEEMVQLHVRLKFDAEAKKMVRDIHKQTLVRQRLTYAGGGFGGILVLLGTLFSYLKLDTATRGYYSGRLKLAAGTVILALAAAGGAVALQDELDKFF